MTKFKNHRSQPYFDLMKEGIKTIEGRLNKGKFSLMKLDDEIEIFTPEEDQSFHVKVIDVRKYHSIEEMLNNENLGKILPNVQTIQEGIAEYRKFYPLSDEKEFGVVAIEVVRIK